MSSLVADLIIWVLLFAGIVFSGFSLMGLLLFPDTKSRMFTAFRSIAISLGALAFAVITYGSALYVMTGSEQYPALILRTLFLAFVLAAGTTVMYRLIRQRTGFPLTPCKPTTGPGPETK